jgi:hypothetical protein
MSLSQAKQIQVTWRALETAERDARRAGDTARAELFKNAQRYGAGSDEWREALDLLTREATLEASLFDRAHEWVNENYPDLEGDDYASAVASAAADIAAIDAREVLP